MARRTTRGGGGGGGGGASDELSKTLEEFFGVRVTRQELEAPTPALVTSVLQAALGALGLNDASLEMPHSLLPAEGAHLEGAVPLLNHLALLQSVFRCLGIDDVGLPDLVDPKPRRIRRLFITLVNNWFHISTVFNSYKEKEQQHLAARAKTDELQAQLDTCTARVNKMGAWLASTADKKRAMMAKLADCSKTLEALSAKKAVIIADYQQLKATLCASAEAVQRAKMELGDISEALREAQASVCGDPAAWKEKTTANAESLAALEKERDQLRSTVSALEEKVNLAPFIREALQGTLDDVTRLEASMVDLEARKQAKAAAEQKRVKLERQHCALQNEVKVASEELARLDLKVGGGQPRDVDAGLQSREQRNSDLRKRCEQMEDAYKTAMAGCSGELADLHTAIAAVEEEIRTTDQETRDHVARNQEGIDKMVGRIGVVARRFQDLYNPNKLPKI